MKTNAIKLSLPQLVGRGYATFWNFKGRYRVCKGSRASKKSKTTALWYITNMMKYPDANLLVIRKTYRTLKDSCFTELKWVISRLKVDAWWEVKESPLELTYKPTGQKIYFRGLDDPLKVTSITVEKGVLCWAWLEEAYEIMNEDDFNVLDESIRGEVPEGLFKQWTITFNPWNEHHWLKKRFFDVDDENNILAMTTNYLCNEWLDDADKRVFETMKKNNPRRYAVAGLGNWGIVDGLVYENWREEAFTLEQIKHCKTTSGLDFGYTNDPTAFFVGFLDIENKRLYVWDEMYEKGMSNKAINNKIVAMGYSKERITADSAEPKSIDELKGLGLRIKGAKKGKDSIVNGIQWIQDLEIVIHPRCTNFLTEISNYTWDEDRFGNKLNKPIDDFNHLMDAMRYALEDNIIGNKWLY
ncbi:PBSX family phage terminase large subunit [Thomasclavelia ramosa]|uniref:PBSX family phage terminase large subunit n=1 Tax=Thomasclavelia ramosa TaxID=1547 RepID=A0A3E3EFM7_9FIRM|nr:PBSX family phage terminase large subunit [Thomasclavelia ramosa]RGD86705.1 PBSX family phage terminase large subunit [Thomasclavelia ramosa]